MPDVTWLLPVPVLLPLLGAGLSLVVGHRERLQQAVSVAALSGSLLASVILLVAVDQRIQVLRVGAWAPAIGIELVADRLSAFMLVVSQVVTLAVLVYSVAQHLADEEPGFPVAVYHPTFLVLSAGVSDAFLTGDLFNLYVGFEILLAASFVLISLGGTRGRIRAGTVYVVVSLVGSAVFLIALALVYAAAGTVNMAQLAQRVPALDPNVVLMLQLLLLVGFGVKAAIFPLSAWLPDSYPSAPAPVTAVFAGLLTKVGIYAIIRVEFMILPGARLSGLLTVVGIATMLVGILGAIVQDDFRRMLSFTLVSHIGFLVWGLALSTRLGLAAAIYYAAHHILVQTALFLIAGLIERARGTTSAIRLHSLIAGAPAIAAMYLISGFNLVGVPPLTGFLGKLGLAQASVQLATPDAWALLVAGIVTSFLTLYAVIRLWNMAFWQSAQAAEAHQEVPAHLTPAQLRRLHREARAKRGRLLTARRLDASLTPMERRGGRTSVSMYAAVWSLVAAQVLMAAFSGPVFAYADRAARDLQDSAPYVAALLDTSAPSGEGEG